MDNIIFCGDVPQAKPRISHEGFPRLLQPLEMDCLGVACGESELDHKRKALADFDFWQHFYTEVQDLDHRQQHAL